MTRPDLSALGSSFSGFCCCFRRIGGCLFLVGGFVGLVLSSFFGVPGEDVFISGVVGMVSFCVLCDSISGVNTGAGIVWMGSFGVCCDSGVGNITSDMKSGENTCWGSVFLGLIKHLFRLSLCLVWEHCTVYDLG